MSARSRVEQRQARQARLARTVAALVVVLALLSALTGYLLHGRDQSAAGAPAGGAVSPAPSPATTPNAAASQSAGSAATAGPTRSAAATAATRTSAGTQPVPAKGDGRFVPVTVPQRTTARTGRVVTYSLRVEGGMRADSAAIARAFGSALLDRRGWQGVDKVRFVQVPPSQVAEGSKPQLTVLVASPAQVSKLCAPLPTHGDTSCDTSAHIVLNYKLWLRGVPYFKGHLDQYREYMVSHEVGHALGHGHQQCLRKGAYAPVMLQQTLGLHGCRPWPWPKRPDAHGNA